MFKLLDTDPTHQFIRQLGQSTLEDSFTFYVNARVHGKQLFSKDLMYAVRGVKLMKSFQKKVEEIRDYQVENGYSVHKRTEFWVRMLSIQLNLGVQISVKRFNTGLDKIETNFNSVVNS